MSIEQNIIDAISISKVSGVPVLFMSNPGLGKTTVMKRYAKKHGLHLESLIGSRFTPEEISGYQVNNGGTHLTHMNPEWYSRVLENKDKGITTLLFIDEISTCSEAVQGSLLSLIFDRTIGSGKFLPEDCIIVSAANYAANLPSIMNIMAPTLNRFAIVNLNENYTSLNLVEEFLGKGIQSVYHTHTPMTQEQINSFDEKYAETWKDIFIKYSDPESSVGVIDISNTGLDGLYTDSGACVYNFISGRSLYYLSKVLKAYKELDIDNEDILYKMIDGLVGAGSLSFKEKKQEKAYRSFIHKQMSKVLSIKTKKTTQPRKLETGNDIASLVNNYLMAMEDLETTPQDNLANLISIIEKAGEVFKVNNVIEKCKSDTDIARFIADLDALLELYNSTLKFDELRNITQPLLKICMNYYTLYCNILDIKIDYNEKFGQTNRLFKSCVYIKRRNENKKIVITKAGIRYQKDSTIPAFYLIPTQYTFLEANLGNMISHDEVIGILVYDRGFKFISVDEYINSSK